MVVTTQINKIYTGNQGSNKQQSKNCKISRKMNNNLRIIEQEVKIVKALASSDLTTRNKQIRRLRKWLQLRSQSSFPFDEEDFIRIWKGLYYHMWYSDKPLVQESLAEELGRLLDCFCGNIDFSVKFFGGFLKIMVIEWFGIDQWRLDKFLMLTRRMLRYLFKVLRQSEWSLQAIANLNDLSLNSVLSADVTCKGLTMHYLDIFFEELAKVAEGSISDKQMSIFVKPFIHFMAMQKDLLLVSHCRTRVFHHLLFQSNLGREYLEKYEAWKEMGFSANHINDLEKVENCDAPDNPSENEEELQSNCKGLDPRAGDVDVYVPELPLNGQYILNEINNALQQYDLTTKRRKILKQLENTFRIYQSGQFPLGVKKMPRLNANKSATCIKRKVNHLENLENELYGVGRKLKQLSKKKRRRLLNSVNYDNLDIDNLENALMEEIPKVNLLKRKKKAQLLLMSDWVEEEVGPPNNKLNEHESSERTCTTANILNVASKKGDGISNKNELPSFEADAKGIDKTEELQPNEKFTNVKEIPEKKFHDLKAVTHENIFKTQNHLKPATELRKQLSLELTNSLGSGTKSTLGKPVTLKAKTLQGRVAEKSKAISKAKLKKTGFSTPLNKKILHSPSHNIQNITQANRKRVRIALKHNTVQKPHEYIQQIKLSPNVPYDASKMPSKSLLKPNCTPSPINPFYKRKIGLNLLNDTF